MFPANRKRIHYQNIFIFYFCITVSYLFCVNVNLFCLSLITKFGILVTEINIFCFKLFSFSVCQIGGELMDFIIVLHDSKAVKTFCSRMHFSLGAGCSAAAGPVGRVVEADVRAGDRGSGMCYTYSCSKGIVSLMAILLICRITCFYFCDIKI